MAPITLARRMERWPVAIAATATTWSGSTACRTPSRRPRRLRPRAESIAQYITSAHRLAGPRRSQSMSVLWHIGVDLAGPAQDTAADTPDLTEPGVEQIAHRQRASRS